MTADQAHDQPLETADPLQDIIRLREQNRVWRLRFYGACVAFAFLFVVSLVQFTSTFVTARLLHETRQEIDKLRNDEGLYELRKARETADLVVTKAKEVKVLADDTRAVSKDVQERVHMIDDLLTRDLELRAKILDLLRKRQDDPRVADRLDRLLNPKEPHEGDPKKPPVCPDPERSK